MRQPRLNEWRWCCIALGNRTTSNSDQRDGNEARLSRVHSTELSGYIVLAEATVIAAVAVLLPQVTGESAAGNEPMAIHIIARGVPGVVAVESVPLHDNHVCMRWTDGWLYDRTASALIDAAAIFVLYIKYFRRLRRLDDLRLVHTTLSREYSLKSTPKSSGHLQAVRLWLVVRVHPMGNHASCFLTSENDCRLIPHG